MQTWMERYLMHSEDQGKTWIKGDFNDIEDFLSQQETPCDYTYNEPLIHDPFKGKDDYLGYVNKRLYSLYNLRESSLLHFENLFGLIWDLTQFQGKEFWLKKKWSKPSLKFLELIESDSVTTSSFDLNQVLSKFLLDWNEHDKSEENEWDKQMSSVLMQPIYLGYYFPGGVNTSKAGVTIKMDEITVSKIKEKPAVYKLYDRQRKLIYIGKYKQPYSRLFTSCRERQASFAKVMFCETQTDIDILEAYLISKLSPPLNVALQTTDTPSLVLEIPEESPFLPVYL